MLLDSNLSIYISKRQKGKSTSVNNAVNLKTSEKVTMAHLSFNREKKQFSSIETKFSLFKVYLVELAQQL